MEVMGRVLGRVEPLVPQVQRDPNKVYKRSAGATGPSQPDWCSRRSCMCSGRGVNGRRCRPSGLAVPVRCTRSSWTGPKAGFFEEIWKAGLAEYNELEGISLEMAEH